MPSPAPQLPLLFYGHHLWRTNTLWEAFHTYDVICPPNNPSTKRLNCILEEASNYSRPPFWNEGFAYYPFFWEKEKNWFNFSDKCLGSETFCHLASILALQRDRLKSNWATEPMEEASWVQKRKELIQSSIILELRTDS